MTHFGASAAPSRDQRIQMTRSYWPVFGICSRKSFPSNSRYSQKHGHKTRVESSRKSSRLTLISSSSFDPRSGLEQETFIGRLNSAATERIHRSATAPSF